MNNATHTEDPVVAYCRTCGRGLTESTKRDVMGVLYCEPCIAARLQGTMPVTDAGHAAAVPPPIPPAPVVVQAVPGAPSPGLAIVLSAVFPFGVGAVYNGQMIKGLVHAGIFASLIYAMNHGAEVLGVVMAFFYFYQIVDAYRTAKAKQLGLAPPPDLFGLSESGFDTQGGSKPPVGAFILIGLGVLFLLSNMGWFEMDWVEKLWPLAPLGLGIWLLYRAQSRVVRDEA